jgi:hypothetical protein
VTVGKEPKAKVTGRRSADENNDVVTVEGGDGNYRRSPCAGCPWRKDNTGSFPAEAFRHSANTAYDMSSHEFGCHESDMENPHTCAGYLLRGSAHNFLTRMKLMRGTVDMNKVHDGGHELHHDYVEMAVENGCSPDDPELQQCRRLPPGL